MSTMVGATTDLGLKRTRNEDYFCADESLGLFVVCDGLGGHRAGDVASRLAVETICQHLRDGGTQAGFRLAEAVHRANAAVYAAGKSRPDCEGMGTTVTAAWLNGLVLSIAHVGDSRLYLLREHRLTQVTADHTLAAEQVRGGLLTEEEAERSPDRHILLRALGLDETVEVDVSEVRLRERDQVLLCSDGLTKGAQPPEILAVLRDTPGPQEACARLVSVANARGGEDNTTVIVIRA